MKSAACPTNDQLVAFVQGQLLEDAGLRIADHLEVCPACETTIRNLETRTETFLVELKRPAGNREYLDEPEFQEARAAVEAFGKRAHDAAVTTAAATGLGRLGQYELLAPLGQGGMGIVYKARHTQLDKTVALKVLPAAGMAAADAVGRFQREMLAIGRLDHPHIVRATDAGESDGVHYLVMEYLEGRDLKQRLAGHDRLPIEWSCECIRQAGSGLQHAHERGLVHRDIKPSNLLVVESIPDRPVVKILDFGLAFIAQPGNLHDLTGTGQVMGTVDYIAPEQARRTRDADIRSDIFSLGCTLFHLLAGQVPFAGDSIAEKLSVRLIEEAPRIRRFRPDVPVALEDVLSKMLARDPAQRFQTPAEVIEVLESFAMSGKQASSAMLADTGKPGASAETQPIKPPRPAAVPRDRFNTQLGDFYKGLTIGTDDLLECAGCGILVPNRQLSMSVGSHILMAVQNRMPQFAAFGLMMKELLGEDYVTMPSNPAGMIVFLDQFAASACQRCGKVLCPACLCGTVEMPGCISCGHHNLRPQVDFNVGSLESVTDKMHAATIVATIPKLDSASDQEFQMIQQVVLGSAQKMQQDVKQGLEVQFVGLALQKFCDVVEASRNRPIDRAVIQEIRDLCRKSLPAQIDFKVLTEFRRCVEQYIKH